MADTGEKIDLIPIGGDRADLSPLSAWAPQLAKTFVALSSDIALVIDRSGVIRNVEQGDTAPVTPAASAWVGQPWIDTVSGDTRGKIERLLAEAASQGIARRREVNHTLQSGANVPVAYTAIRLGENGPVLAVGRDMRAIAAIQERFIESQQDMERSYWHVRQAESRYRLLFQVANDAVIVVDAETLLILDANPAASALFSNAGEQLVGKHATVGFAHASRGAVNELLATARSSGQTGEIRARLLGTIGFTSVAATSFRAHDAMRILIRVRETALAHANGPDAGIAKSVDSSDDAVIVTDSSGRVVLANPALLNLLHLGGEANAKGRLLAHWLGSVDRPLDSLIEQVREHGVVQRFTSIARPSGAAALPVDISAVLLTEGDQECIGFTVRRAATAASNAPHPRALQDGIEFLAERIGDLPLAALVSEAAAIAERHFVRLALERSGNDADAAAVLLGLDRGQLPALATGTPPADPARIVASTGHNKRTP